MKFKEREIAATFHMRRRSSASILSAPFLRIQRCMYVYLHQELSKSKSALCICWLAIYSSYEKSVPILTSANVHGRLEFFYWENNFWSSFARNLERSAAAGKVFQSWTLALWTPQITFCSTKGSVFPARASDGNILKDHFDVMEMKRFKLY